MARERHILELSEEALFRLDVVSAAGVWLKQGFTRAGAIAEVLKVPWSRPLSARTVYRWLAAHEQQGPLGLEPEARSRIADSRVLSRRLIDFLKREKQSDPQASLPEVIARARLKGVLAPDEKPSRTSLWRAARRLELPLTRPRRLASTDMRRWRYPHRMDCVLADGKRFRASAARLRRLALFFLDNATRYGLDVLVGTEETTELFLTGLYFTVEGSGLMGVLFLDNGSGFISRDTRLVVARLKVSLIYGTARYPEGHGAIEAFNKTVKNKLLRTFDGNPEIDSAPEALRLRLRHWLHEVYNHTPHEGLGGRTPAHVWHEDTRPLAMPPDRGWLKEAFVSSFTRRVSKDNVLSHDGRDYEVPRGHATERIRVFRNLLDPERSLSILHEGRLVKLHLVDVVANAYSRRARPRKLPAPQGQTPPETSGALAYNRDLGPLVDADGGYPEKGEDHED